MGRQANDPTRPDGQVKLLQDLKMPDRFFVRGGGFLEFQRIEPAILEDQQKDSETPCMRWKC